MKTVLNLLFVAGVLSFFGGIVWFLGAIVALANSGL
jgi:hypothetical protein